MAVGVEAAAAGITALAAIEASWQAIRVFVARPTMPDAAKESLRLGLARWLAVALEFALAADILRTAIAPSWDELGKLAAIAELRTILNFFLQREIADEAARRRRGDTPAEHMPATADHGRGNASIRTVNLVAGTALATEAAGSVLLLG